MSDIMDKITEICKNVDNNPTIIKKYSHDLSLVSAAEPLLVVYPENTEQCEQIVNLANEMNFSIIPVSSPLEKRLHGDSIPKTERSIIMDLSRMDEILRIDKKNRVIMVEPGVTYGKLIDVAKKNGLRLNKTLYPRKNKSVLASALEREPPTIPRYHWDSSDPLLCTEVIFGDGNYFRTGIAAGPGSVEQQLESGQAQKNPMGPTQFSPFRLLQGSQGSFGVVTWATIKCEYLQDKEKLFFSQSDDLSSFFDLIRHVIKYRMVDEIFIVNKVSLATLLNIKLSELDNLMEWILLYNITGRGKFAQDKIDYIVADINDLLDTFEIELTEQLGDIKNEDLYEILHGTCDEAWQCSLEDSFQDIFYITTLDKTTEHYELVKGLTDLTLGVYIQPIMQGCAVHCEFDLFYNPEKVSNQKVKEDFMKISTELMDNGAFFNRPYGLWADEMYARVSSETIDALQKVKKIFDPNNVMNRGALCFKEE
ncbi:MAG: FAD-binding protein [Candidatus Lokiarchaeota archaeon]|nr:FAD-binding protein [Candidatus Lokiarchaeota archaeon]